MEVMRLETNQPSFARRNRWLLTVGALVALVAADAIAAEIRIPLESLTRKGDAYQLELDEKFGDWPNLPDDLRQIRFKLPKLGKDVDAVFVEGNRPSMYARWYVATSAIPTQGVGHLLLEWQQTGNSNRLPVSDGENASLAGGNASTLPQGELADGQSIWGFQLCLKSDGWARVAPVPRLFPVDQPSNL